MGSCELEQSSMSPCSRHCSSPVLVAVEAPCPCLQALLRTSTLYHCVESQFCVESPCMEIFVLMLDCFFMVFSRSRINRLVKGYEHLNFNIYCPAALSGGCVSAHPCCQCGTNKAHTTHEFFLMRRF